ncbi:hypothetical protein RDI58_001230 [Solanum bulbocastanum]|uniref:Uncharacterized protein n=1 Tax=Solanum bulbocastanum TaxID=147425 RepID=A0AAN8YPZ8_SOLBU
MNSRQSPC